MKKYKVFGVIHQIIKSLYSMKHKLIDSLLPSTWIKCTIGLLCDCIASGRDKPKSFTGHKFHGSQCQT